jgi:hypothetical protein
MASLLGSKTASVAALAALGDGLDDGMKERFEQLNKKPFRDQAVWFMNGFWVDGPAFGENADQRELMWGYVNRMVELHPDGENGYELDEFKGHVFLEKSGMTLTVAKMRAVMKEIDLDFNKKISLSEFLIFHYRVQIADLVDAPQAADPAAAKRIAAARKAVNMAKAQSEAAIQAESESQKAAAAAAAAAETARKALEVLHAQEKAFADKCAALEAKGSDMSLGVVKRGRANQELAQLRQTDPLPLNRAKITQAAAVRKLKKAKKKADKTAAAATEARTKAEAAFAKAEGMLQTEIKKASGGGQGELWWMSRELEEAKKFMSPAQLRKLAKQQAAAAGESKE